MITENQPIQPPASGASETRARPALRPTFLGALRGAWLFTWKSRLIARRWPALLTSLLLLPLLIYITMTTRTNWSQRQIWMGNAQSDVVPLLSSLTRNGPGLAPAQAQELARIFAEEYAQTEQALSDLQAAEATRQRSNAEIQACFQRIRERAGSLFGETQLRQLQLIEQQKLLNLERARGRPAWSRTTPFHRLLVDLYFFVILPVGCVAASGALIREEVQANTLGFLTTRPLTRARLVLVKFLAQTAWLQLLFALQTLLIFGAGQMRQVPELGSMLLLFLGVQCLAVLAWSALGTFLGLVSKRYMGLALLYGFVVELGIGRIPTNINSLSMMRHLKSLLSHSPALQDIFLWPSRGVFFSIGSLLVATAVFASLAVALFTFQEYHHTTEMQK